MCSYLISSANSDVVDATMVTSSQRICGQSLHHQRKTRNVSTTMATLVGEYNWTLLILRGDWLWVLDNAKPNEYSKCCSYFQ
jgi:hypothetical protein